MRIVPATCPICGGEYDPLRARATLVVDGKVRAYCSSPCKERAAQPHPELPVVDHDLDDYVPPPLPSMWSRMSWKGAFGVAAAGAVVLALGGKLVTSAPPSLAAIAPAMQPRSSPPSAADALAMLAPSTG